MKRKITSALTSLAIALGSFTGCPNNDEDKARMRERVYTNPKRIKEKFVINKGTGEVYVNKALRRNPMTPLSSNIFNIFARSSKSLDIYALDSTAKIDTIYSMNLEQGANNEYLDDWTVGTIERVVEIANLYGESFTVNIGEGDFFYTEDALRVHQPMEIYGSGATTNLDISMVGHDYLYIDSITSRGADTLPYDPAGFVFLKGGGLANSSITENCLIGINIGYNLDFVNNKVNTIQSQWTDSTINFFNVNLGDTPLTPKVNFSYNSFTSLPKIFLLADNVAQATVDNNLIIQNNAFIDNANVVYAPIGNTKDINMTLNYWAETIK